MVSGGAFDCFLSHNSKDKEVVRALAAALRTAGVSYWLDDDQCIPGDPHQPLMEAGIRNSGSMAVMIGIAGIGPWEDEEQQAGIAFAVKDRRRVIPVILPTAPSVPDLPVFLANRTWVDLRPGAYSTADEGLACLIWGIRGKRPDPETVARAYEVFVQPSSPGGPRVSDKDKDANPKAKLKVEPATKIHQTAQREIAAHLDAAPTLLIAVAVHANVPPPVDAQRLATWLCPRDADGVRAAMRALRLGIRDAALAQRRAQGDLAALRDHGRDILGWMSVVTVLDDYGSAQAPRVQNHWFDGAAFRIPLGRNACIAVLASRWAGRKTDFEPGRDRWDYGRYDLSPHPKADPGMNNLLCLDPEPALNYVRGLVYQHIEGKEPPPLLDPDTWREIRERLSIRREEMGEQRRIVLDGRGPANAFDYSVVLTAIHADIPEVDLIVLVGPREDHPEVFLLPAAKLSGQIKECLEAIEAIT
jgi:hypothetical protein